MLTRFLVVLFVEAPHQFFEDGAHAVIVEAGVFDSAVTAQHRVRAQIDVGRQQLLDQSTQSVGLGQARDLITEFEIVEDVLHVGREAVEVGFEVRFQLLLTGAGFEVAQGERRSVMEGLASGLAQGLILVGDLGLVELGLHGQHRLLARLQHCIEPAQHGHRQDDVAVFAAYVEIAQYVVRDTPDEIGNPVERYALHIGPSLKWWCAAWPP